MSDRRIAGVILAAGASQRMGRQKLLLPWGEGNTILGAVLDQAIAAGLDQLVLVCGADRAAVESVAAAKGVPSVYNPDYRLGQSTSLRQGLAALPADTGAMFILGDQPYVTADVMGRLAQAYRESTALVVAPRTRDGRRGNPVVFAPSLFPELRALEGDQGGRSVLPAHLADTLYLEVPGEGILQDLDTMEQYHSAQEAPPV